MTFNGIIATGIAIFIFGLAVIPYVSSSDDETYIQTNARHGNHSIIIGERSSYNRLYFHQHVRIPGKRFTRITKDISYRQTRIFYRAPNEHISCIKILDLKNDGTGGYGYVLSGGLGQNHVTVRLESQIGHDILFNITVYGSP